MQDLIAKLRRSSATNAIFGGRVAGSASADGARIIEYNNMTVPCAYVCFIGDQAQPHPPGANTDVQQRVTEHWGVAVKLDAREEIRGQASAMNIPLVRQGLMLAIFNWSPDPHYDLISYNGCELIAINRDVTVWLFKFLTSYIAHDCEGETEEQFDPLPWFLRLNIRVDYIWPFDPLLPPSLGYDVRYPPPLTTGPDGRIEAEFMIEYAAPGNPLP